MSLEPYALREIDLYLSSYDLPSCRREYRCTLHSMSLERGESKYSPGGGSRSTKARLGLHLSYVEQLFHAEPSVSAFSELIVDAISYLASSRCSHECPHSLYCISFMCFQELRRFCLAQIQFLNLYSELEHCLAET